MPNALVPELAVSNWQASRRFYGDILGFRCAYERPEEGFSFLALGAAELMIDQIGIGRSFDGGHLPKTYPFGQGLNLQIRVASLTPLLQALAKHGVALFLPPEEKWYRVGDVESCNRNDQHEAKPAQSMRQSLGASGRRTYKPRHEHCSELIQLTQASGRCDISSDGHQASAQLADTFNQRTDIRPGDRIRQVLKFGSCTHPAGMRIRRACIRLNARIR